MYYGYHSVKQKDLGDDYGQEQISGFCKKYGFKLESIFVDQLLGTGLDRARYTVLKEDVLKRGDTLIIVGFGRLGSTKTKISKELLYFKDHGIKVIALTVPVSHLMGHITNKDKTMAIIYDLLMSSFVEVYASLSREENEYRKMRQRKGIKDKKKREDWKDYGRPRAMSPDEFAFHYQQVLRGVLNRRY